jgi:hypothetical protein
MSNNRIANSGDSNVITNKKHQKYLRYKELKTEIKCIWNVKANEIPVITRGNRNHLRVKWKAQKSRNYRKQPYYAQRSYFGKY